MEDFYCFQKLVDIPDESVHVPKVIPHTYDGSLDVLDDTSQLATNEGSVKVEIDDVQDTTVLPPVPSFQCSVCTQSFSTRGNLTRHFRKFHESG